MTKKRTDLFAIFEKEFAVTIEELATKDGTGRKYGRPRRLSQERTRSEMNKCEQSQDAINGFIESIKEMYNEF
jgi:hypothetical protein